MPERKKLKRRIPGRVHNSSAAPKTSTAVKRPIGRPSGYIEAYATMARKLRMLGLSTPKICDILEVGEQAVRNWRAKVPEFKQAWDEGGAIADAEVAKAMYHRAVGYSHPAEKLFYDKSTGEVVRATYIEHYPPDTAAGKFLLTNRQPDIWKERSTKELTGPEGQTLLPPIIVVTPVPAGQRPPPTIEGKPE